MKQKLLNKTQLYFVQVVLRKWINAVMRTVLSQWKICQKYSTQWKCSRSRALLVCLVRQHFEYTSFIITHPLQCTLQICYMCLFTPWHKYWVVTFHRLCHWSVLNWSVDCATLVLSVEIRGNSVLLAKKQQRGGKKLRCLHEPECSLVLKWHLKSFRVAAERQNQRQASPNRCCVW